MNKGISKTECLKVYYADFLLKDSFFLFLLNSFIKTRILIKELGPIKIIIVCNYEMMKI